MNASPPPGWYPDPEQAGQPRWWDGQAWAPSMPVSSTPEPQRFQPQNFGPQPGFQPQNFGPQPFAQQDSPFGPNGAGNQTVGALEIIGYIMAVIFPLLGVLLGAVSRSHGNRHGRRIMLVALAFIVLGVILAAAISSHSSTPTQMVFTGR